MRSDSDTQRSVQRELEWDSRLANAEIGVAVHQGAVTLTGIVDSFAKRMAAQEAAHRVYGVRDVANDIAVKPATSHQRTDTEIAQALRTALEWDALVPDERIMSNVSDGHVTLAGSVDTIWERQDAERAVRNLPGVKGVTNAIFVVEPVITEPEVRAEITAALERRADRAARHIDMEIHHGTVTLHGPVRSWAEREAVLGAARYMPGVRTVDDKLHIDVAS